MKSSERGIYSLIQKILERNVSDGQRVLEIGCGLGLISDELKMKHPNLLVVKLDINPRIKPNVIADCQNLPFKNKSFDLAFSEGVFEHKPIDFEKALKESVRVAKKSIHFFPNGLHPVYLAKKYLGRLLGKWIWDKKYGYERNITPFHFRNFKVKKMVFFDKEIGVII
jgi:ubiquinone/menaquinone biosynthesis C-methylase UbiE